MERTQSDWTAANIAMPRMSFERSCFLIVLTCAIFAQGWAAHVISMAHGAERHAGHVRGATGELDPANLTTAPASSKKPNIVFVLADDLAMNLLQYMPNVQQMQKEGTTFSNYFVTDSLCCPSRSSIFTGKFPHDTGVFTNTGDDGGYNTFNSKGNEAHTFAVALQHGGYKTAMMGKYLNGYLPRLNRPAPGWNEWDVAGMGYKEFNYALNENGKIVRYGQRPEEYLTDVVARLGDAFIRKSAGHPFFIEIATFAPHGPYIPAPRDADKFPGLTAPRTAAYGARPDANAPNWLKGIFPLRPVDKENIDKDFRMRAQSVQAIDKMIGELRAELARLGEDNTYFIFSSDNGYHMGEFSMRPGKMTSFDTDIQVPLIVIGPGLAKGQVVDSIAENVDLCPTFAELAGVSSEVSPDGHSLVALLRGEHPADWRDFALVEHRHPVPNADDPDVPVPHGGNPPSYEAMRTANAMYVEYMTGEVGYYDLVRDPAELHNAAQNLDPAKRKKLHDALEANKNCHGAEACWAAQKLTP
jgi:N-acetylglucosamine-6-sulfatase